MYTFIYVYLYVYNMYIYTYTCIYIGICIYTHTYIYTYTYTDMYAHMHSYSHDLPDSTCTFKYTCVYVYMYTYRGIKGGAIAHFVVRVMHAAAEQRDDVGAKRGHLSSELIFSKVSSTVIAHHKLSSASKIMSQVEILNKSARY